MDKLELPWRDENTYQMSTSEKTSENFFSRTAESVSPTADIEKITLQGYYSAQYLLRPIVSHRVRITHQCRNTTVFWPYERATVERLLGWNQIAMGSGLQFYMG